MTSFKYIKTRYKENSLEMRFWPKIHKTNQCWIWLALVDRDGYGKIEKSPPEKGTLRAHRVSWMIHHGLIPENLNVLHKCDNPGCVNPSHLFLGGAKENARDCMIKRRHPMIKLSVEEIYKVRCFCDAGLKDREISEKTGVERSQVNRIRNRKIWQYVQKEIR